MNDQQHTAALLARARRRVTTAATKPDRLKWLIILAILEGSHQTKESYNPAQSGIIRTFVR